MLEFSDLVIIERTKNVMANGRLFNVLTFMLVLFVASRNPSAPLWLAVFPILSIGSAYLADGFGVLHRALAIITVAAAIVPLAIVFFI